MSLATKSPLKVDTIDKIQKLIRANIDSCDEFAEVSKQINNAFLSELFEQLALDRSSNAGELQVYVQCNGEVAETGGTFGAILRIVWIDIRSVLSDGDPHTVLAEVERCEDRIKEEYEQVMAETEGCEVNELLMKQYLSITAAHDVIRSLRDQYQQPA